MPPRFEDRTCPNLSSLVAHIINDVGACSEKVWFRGHGDSSWPLVPSIYRGATVPDEMTLIKKFKQNATLLITSNGSMKSWDWLFVMRHHTVPTRLLDWTESPLIAAYFAVYEKSDSNGAIWALLPTELNNQAKITFIPSFEEDDELSSYSPDSLRRESTSSLFPLAIIAPRNNTRMQAQLSVFTVNHRDKTPIELINGGNHTWRYVIPKECKSQIQRELEMIGISKFQLFPELQSIGEMLTNG